MLGGLEMQVLEDLLEFGKVGALQVHQQAPAQREHSVQATPAGVVLLVLVQVRGELRDAGRQPRYLEL